MSDQFTYERSKQQLRRIRGQLEALPLIVEQYPTQDDFNRTISQLEEIRTNIKEEKIRANTNPADVIDWGYIPALDEVLIFLGYCLTDTTSDQVVSHIHDAEISIDWMLSQIKTVQD